MNRLMQDHFWSLIPFHTTVTWEHYISVSIKASNPIQL